MDPVIQIRVTGGSAGDSADPGRTAAASAPGWVPARPSRAAQLALITFLVIVGLPLAILIGMAVAAAALVFSGLTLLGAAWRRLGSGLPGGDGRSNVRVIQRDDTRGPT